MKLPVLDRDRSRMIIRGVDDTKWVPRSPRLTFPVNHVGKYDRADDQHILTKSICNISKSIEYVFTKIFQKVKIVMLQ